MPEDSLGELAAARDSDGTAESAGYSLPIRNLYLGIFLTSAAVLLLQISLTRIFSYTIWYHFTYVTISLAMLGFGASGAVLASSEKLARLDIKLAHKSVLVGAISVPFMLAVISKVPFYPFQLFKEPAQIGYLVVYYVAVTIPFFCAGMAISCAFRSLPQKANRIYFWDLVGAGMGCLAAVIAIKLIGAPGLAAVTAAIFLLASALFLERRSNWKKLVIVAIALVCIPTGVNVEKVFEFNASKEKWVSRMGRDNVIFSKWSPIFRVDVIKPRFIRRSQQTGKSEYGIKSTLMPLISEHAFIAHDGDACAKMIGSDDKLSSYDVFDKGILQTPYLIKEHPDVLIIGPGGGVDVGMAIKNKANSILAIELDPITVDLVSNEYADFVGHLYNRPNVKVVVDEGRSFLRRSGKKFDIIQMTSVDTLAALNSGAYVLAESYLYTTEAYDDFMERLNPNGVLSINTRDFHYKASPPRFAARQASLSVAALKKRGIEDPSNHIALIAANKGGRFPTWFSIITKMSQFTSSEVETLKEFAEELSFDIWYLPGEKTDNPYTSIITSTDEERSQFYENNFLKVDAPTDEAPFYFHFYRWQELIEQYEIDTGHTMATGQLILLLLLVFSIVFSVALIIFPLFRFRRSGLRTKWKWHYILYFAALGLGFIFLEISYIQRFILFLGYPTYSLTVILFSLLTFSGVGSYLSGRLPLSLRSLIMVAVVLLAAVALSYMVLLPPIFNYFLGAPKQVRIAISLALLFPLGLLLGVFFPAGIKIISAEDKRFVPWAWGINGCASVIGTVLSIIIAMSHGFSTVTVLAVFIYLIGVLAMFQAGKEHEADNA